MELSTFYQGKKVFVTGHTGFKGGWLCKLLLAFGAQVFGYALEPASEPNLFQLSGLAKEMESRIGDIRDLAGLKKQLDRIQPEIVFHLAAQPIVRIGYSDPAGTYETNIMGTVHILECIRQTPSVRSFLNITTDKVYQNKEWVWAYREIERLNGFDPYSNSKSCAELVTECYRNSFFSERCAALSTARAGNVIGGGDFSADRIIPDCVRAVTEQRDIVVRSPRSIRPYQHALDALYAYLLIAAEQYETSELSGAYNIGPEDTDFLETGDLVSLFVKAWGDGARWITQPDQGPHEDLVLRIDCSKMKERFHWRPRWGIESAVKKTVEWYRCWREGQDVNRCMERQISEFLENEIVNIS